MSWRGKHRCWACCWKFQLVVIVILVIIVMVVARWSHLFIFLFSPSLFFLFLLFFQGFSAQVPSIHAAPPRGLPKVILWQGGRPGD
jgi:hypothetical protein